MVFGIITSGLGKIADTLLDPISLVVEKSARLCAETFNVSDGAMATIKSAPMLYKIMAFGTAVYKQLFIHIKKQFHFIFQIREQKC